MDISTHRSSSFYLWAAGVVGSPLLRSWRGATVRTCLQGGLVGRFMAHYRALLWHARGRLSVAKTRI